MAEHKFTLQQIDRFNDSIENCLRSATCCEIFKKYLMETKRNHLLDILRLWVKTNDPTSQSSSMEDIFDIIEEIDGFNENPLLSLSEPKLKLDYIRTECYRLLNQHNMHSKFLQYLRRYHSV